MNNSDTYKTVKQTSNGIYKEKGSKFMAYVFPVSDEQKIKEILNRIKKEHHSARHHCYAWRMGTNPEDYRMNDDGEPSGTAGRPIFGQIKSRELTNVLVIVVRYFGGILLGTSGLTNAYKLAANDALKNAEIIEQVMEDFIEVKFDYTALNDYMYIVKDLQLNQLEADFHLRCSATLSVRKAISELVLDRLNKNEKIRATIVIK